jgi:pyruvate dehydrogenase E1 component beta subunit
MLGGQTRLPITYTLMVSGSRGGQAGQHSDNPYPYLLHAGFKVVCPSTPYEAKGLLVSAIREDDPVIFIAPALVLGQRGEVPEELYSVPLGIGAVKREGTDVTVIAAGNLVPDALAVAETLAAEDISVQVWDPRTLLPLDRDGMCRAVASTGRVVVYDDANRTCGFAAEVSAILAERSFGDLRAPIKRVTRADVPMPFSTALEQMVLPTRDRLATAIRNVCFYNGSPA